MSGEEEKSALTDHEGDETPSCSPGALPSATFNILFDLVKARDSNPHLPKQKGWIQIAKQRIMILEPGMTGLGALLFTWFLSPIFLTIWLIRILFGLKKRNRMTIPMDPLYRILPSAKGYIASAHYRVVCLEIADGRWITVQPVNSKSAPLPETEFARFLELLGHTLNTPIEKT